MTNSARHLFLLPTALLALGLTACPTTEAPDDPDDPFVETDGGQPVELDAGLTGEPVTFKVMSWNVHDLFDDIDNPALVNDEGGEMLRTSTQVSTKLGKLAAVIKGAEPDVLALQEVETKELLGRLNEKLGSSALANFELMPTFDRRGINVAIMSRFPIVKVVSHGNEGDRFYHPDSPRTFTWPRDCLEVHLDLGGNRTVVVLVNHHTSAISDEDGLEREAQSMRARAIADGLRAQNPLWPVLITGDMNSDEGSEAVKILSAGGGFVDVGMKVSASSRWTYVFSGDKQRLDYILPDSRSAAWVKEVYFVHSPAVDTASDHEPVTVTFTY